SFLAFSAAFLMAAFSRKMGTDCPPMANAATARTPMNTSPKKDNPRWRERLAERYIFITYPLDCWPWRRTRSMERADALEITEIHPHEKGLADDVALRHEAPVARVQRVVPVVAHHEIVPLGNLAHHAFDTVAAVVAIGKVAGALHERGHLRVVQQA